MNELITIIMGVASAIILLIVADKMIENFINSLSDEEIDILYGLEVKQKEIKEK